MIGCGTNWPTVASSGGAVEGLKPSAASDGETAIAVWGAGAGDWLSATGAGSAGGKFDAVGAGGGAGAVGALASTVGELSLCVSALDVSGAGADTVGGEFCGTTTSFEATCDGGGGGAAAGSVPPRKASALYCERERSAASD